MLFWGDLCWFLPPLSSSPGFTHIWRLITGICNCAAVDVFVVRGGACKVSSPFFQSECLAKLTCSALTHLFSSLLSVLRLCTLCLFLFSVAKTRWCWMMMRHTTPRPWRLLSKKLTSLCQLQIFCVGSLRWNDNVRKMLKRKMPTVG